MNKPLPRWLTRCLNLPGWKLLLMQWLALSGPILLFGLLLLQGKWQQLGQTQVERQRLKHQMTPLWAQLARMPTMEALNQQLQQIKPSPVANEALLDVLQQVGAGLQRWQQQEKASRQALRLHLEYGSLLRLLEKLPTRLRIEQMTVETQTEGVSVHFTFQDVAEAVRVAPYE